MFARFLVELYRFVHGRLHLPGAGWLIRRFVPLLPRLRDYPLTIPSIGTARLDFRDVAAFLLLNVTFGETVDLGTQLKWMKKVLRPGSVFWDVGANVGYLDLWLLLNHPSIGVIHSFEPNPNALHTLQSLFKENGKVRVHPVGLGDVDATMQMNAPPGGSICGSVVQCSEGSKSIRITIRNGDSYAAQNDLPPPDVLKVDVEAFEPQVFAGLAGTIRKHRPVIFFEQERLTPEQVRSLVPEGYALHFILETGELTQDWNRRGEAANALLVPEEKAELLRGTV